MGVSKPFISINSNSDKNILNSFAEESAEVQEGGDTFADGTRATPSQYQRGE